MIYFDNGATTFPKPRRVVTAVQNAMELYGANPGRSGHKLSLDTAIKVYEARESVARLFAAEVEHVTFTANCSHALNMAIKGALRQGDHVIISDLEHNSVLRPVHVLASRELISYSVATVQRDDGDTVAEFERLITPGTRMIACTHASNAFGVRVPIRAIGEMAHRHGVLFLVDAAQTAGVLDIDMQRDHIDFLCTAGHKSLYGPSGTGLMITPHGEWMNPLMEGGTGSDSANYFMPDSVPDRLECGTVNTAGIIGLGAGIAYIESKGMHNIHGKEMRIGADIFRRLQETEGVLLYTEDFTVEKNLPVISFNIEGMPSEEVTDRLSDMGFALRGGLHCAPLAHKKMGTIESGAARISIGALNTPEQAVRLCGAIAKIAAAR